MYNYEWRLVMDAATGCWDRVFSQLAPDLSEAQRYAGKQVTNPKTKEKKAFRLNSDYAYTGRSHVYPNEHNTNGFKTLEWVNNWSFNRAVNEVGALLLPDLKGGKVIKKVEKNEVHKGKVKSLGLTNAKHGSVFTITIETAGNKQDRLWGKSLQDMVSGTGLKVGDNCRITLICQQIVEVGLKPIKRNVWSVVKLESDEQRENRLKREAIENKRKRDSLVALWNSGKPLDMEDESNLVKKYFDKRGLKFKNSDMEAIKYFRYVPNLEYWDEGKKSFYPSLISLVLNTSNKCASIHRTYLSSDGFKANVDEPKKLMSHPDDSGFEGAAVRIGGMPKESICLAEGIETSLSVHLAMKIPCWSALSASGLTNVQLPRNATKVYIFADKDKSEAGKIAAEKLAERLREEGRLVAILFPEQPIPENANGIDWNDVLVQFGASAFPKLENIELS